MSTSMKERIEATCPLCKHGIELSGYVHVIARKKAEGSGIWVKCFAAEFLDLVEWTEPSANLLEDNK